MPKFKNEVGNRYGNLLVLYQSNKKVCGRIYWHCKCDCGNECDVDGTKLRTGHTKSCGCARIKANHNKAENLTGKRFGKLTVLKKIDSKEEKGITWLCQCDCGNFKEVKSRYLKLGETTSCGCLFDLTGKIFGELTVIKRMPTKNGNSQWLCKCQCGNYKIISAKHLKDTISCGCKNISKGEYKISKILSNNNISFIKEKTFDSCRFLDTNCLARFDFYVDNKYLIEFDGEQHYKCNGWYTEEEFKRIQKRDAYKNQWCKENNIPLIRIPYTYLEDLTLKDLLLETSHFIL